MSEKLHSLLCLYSLFYYIKDYVLLIVSLYEALHIM